MIVLSDKILKRIKRHGRGKWVFTPKDFLDLGTRAAVDQVLSRLVSRGQLRRVGRGLYDWPRMSTVLKHPGPADLSLIVKAIARRDGIRIMPSGMVAANQLGLTNAIPARVVYLTDGPTRTVQLSRRTINFKHTSPKLMQWTGRAGGPVVSALIWLDSNIATSRKIINTLRRQLPDTIKRDLLQGIAYLPIWMVPVVRQIQDDAA